MILTMTTQNTNHPCACGNYSFEVLIHENVGGGVWQQKTTGCTATTQSTFAPGHDAKLKSLLIAAGVGGHQVRKVHYDTVTVKDALGVAADLGWENLVREAIARASR